MIHALRSRAPGRQTTLSRTTSDSSSVNSSTSSVPVDTGKSASAAAESEWTSRARRRLVTAAGSSVARRSATIADTPVTSARCTGKKRKSELAASPVIPAAAATALRGVVENDRAPASTTPRSGGACGRLQKLTTTLANGDSCERAEVGSGRPRGRRKSERGRGTQPHDNCLAVRRFPEASVDPVYSSCDGGFNPAPGSQLQRGRAADSGRDARSQRARPASQLLRVLAEELRCRRRTHGRALSIVDLGCRVGHRCVTLAEIPGATLVGVDSSAETLDFACERYA